MSTRIDLSETLLDAIHRLTGPFKVYRSIANRHYYRLLNMRPCYAVTLRDLVASVLEDRSINAETRFEFVNYITLELGVTVFLATVKSAKPLWHMENNKAGFVPTMSEMTGLEFPVLRIRTYADGITCIFLTRCPKRFSYDREHLEDSYWFSTNVIESVRFAT